MKKILWTTFLLCAGTAFAASQGGLGADETISVDELRQKQLRSEPFTLFDARGPKSYEDAHIEGAVLPMAADYYERDELFRKGTLPDAPNAEDALGEAMQKYSRETPVVTYCNSNCAASATLLFQLKKLGFQNVRAMTEGMQEWEKRGYPVVKRPIVLAANPLIPSQAPCGEDTPCS